MTVKALCAHLLLATVPAMGCGSAALDTELVRPAHVEPARDTATMTVTGLATLEVAPDIADVVFTLRVEAPKPKAAVQALRPRQAELQELLIDAGITGDSLRVSTLSVHPIVQYVSGVEHIRGYRALTVVTASTDEFGRVPDLMEAGATAGASSMHTRFRNTEMPELKKQVRDMALAAAMEKAEQMAKKVGVAPARVLEVSEVALGQAWAVYGGVENAVAQTDGAAAAGLNPDVLPLSLSVTLKYELGPTVAG